MADDDTLVQPQVRRASDVILARLQQDLSVFSSQLQAHMTTMQDFRLGMPDTYITRREFTEHIADKDRRLEDMDRRQEQRMKELDRVQTERMEEYTRRFSRLDGTLSKIYLLAITTLCTGIIAIALEFLRRVP